MKTVTRVIRWDVLTSEISRISTLEAAAAELSNLIGQDVDEVQEQLVKAGRYHHCDSGFDYLVREVQANEESLLVYLAEGGRARIVDVRGELLEAHPELVDGEGDAFLDNVVGNDFTIEDPGLHLVKVLTLWPGGTEEYYFEAIEIEQLTPAIQSIDRGELVSANRFSAVRSMDGVEFQVYHACDLEGLLERVVENAFSGEILRVDAVRVLPARSYRLRWCDATAWIAEDLGLDDREFRCSSSPYPRGEFSNHQVDGEAKE